MWEEEEFEELERNAKAAGLEDDPLFNELKSTLLLMHKTRRLISEVIRKTKDKPRGLLDMQKTEESFENRLKMLNERIQTIVYLLKKE